MSWAVPYVAGLYALACPDPAAVPDAWRTGPVIVREGAG